jgi:peptidoglycan/LPS O-acetylase OafA/YrhL
MTTTPPLTLSRIRSLDGLRGLAALTVVLGHARLVVLQNTDSDLVRFAPIRIPLDFIATMGGHAVWLFFILSGFVLSRMFLENKVTDYGRYILGRLARLYLPVWGALMLVLVCMLAVPRNVAGLGSWVSGHPTQATASDFVKDMFLMLGTSGNLSPLWSLQWEVLFSLLLIVYVTLPGKHDSYLHADVWPRGMHRSLLGPTPIPV